MSSGPLVGTQADHASELAHNEVRQFARLLLSELESNVRDPERGTRPLRAMDLYRSVDEALSRYERDEQAQ